MNTYFSHVLLIFRSSPAYQAYMQAKSRGTPVIEDPEPRGIRIQERRIDIQPAEDEEDPDDGLSIKHVAHSRFTRNHRLINDILSETMVPDVRSVVTTARIQVLKRQLNSLTSHHEKFEAELAQIDETYQAKKKKFLESSEEFNKELKKHCVAAVDDNKYKEMVEEQLEKIKTEREERARAGAPTPPSPAPPTDPADNRHVLQPVERGENPDSPDESSQASADGSKDSDKKDEEGKSSEDGDKKSNGPSEPPLKYDDMSSVPQPTTLRPPSQTGGAPSPANSATSGTPPPAPGQTPSPRGATPPPNVTAPPPPHGFPPTGPPQQQSIPPSYPPQHPYGSAPSSQGGYYGGPPSGYRPPYPPGYGGHPGGYQPPPQGSYPGPAPGGYRGPPPQVAPPPGAPNQGPPAPTAHPVPATEAPTSQPPSESKPSGQYQNYCDVM